MGRAMRCLVGLGLLSLLLGKCFSWMNQPRAKVSRNIHANDERATMNLNYLVKESSAMTKSALRRKMALRKPLPERLALIFPEMEGHEGQMQDARLLNFDVGGQSVEVSLPKDGEASGGTMTLQEKHASLWRVQSSEVPELLGALVQLYDATPKQLAPLSAEQLGAVKSSILQSSSGAKGGMRWNGVTGFSPESCPRDFDGVHVAYTVWDCMGASGACRMLREGEDDNALVCEFGAMKRGIATMIPGETRRFWIPGDVKDRRFGQPLPATGLPSGDVVVDLTLLSVQRDAVFDYKLSDEAIKLGEMRERQPAVVAQRALGVGIQLWTWALVYSYYQAPEDLDVIGFSQSVHL